MLTITDAQLAHMAKFNPDTIGALLIELLDVPADCDVPDITPGEGWSKSEPGVCAADRYHGRNMSGYRSYGDTITVTLIGGAEGLVITAETRDWAIEANGQYAGWIEMPAESATGDRNATDSDNEHDDGDEEKAPAAGSDAEWRSVHLLTTGTIFADVPAHTSWIDPAFDWAEEIARNPGYALSRLTVMAQGLGISWAPYVTTTETGVATSQGTSPAGEMLAAIERRLGIKGSGEWIKQFGVRLRDAEAAFMTNHTPAN